MKKKPIMIRFLLILYMQLLLLCCNLQEFCVQASVLRIWSQICISIQSNYDPRKTPGLNYHHVTQGS